MSTVIKAGQPGRYLKNLSSVRLTDHFAEAKQAMETARRQAEQTLAQAKEEKKRVFEEARETGRKTGHEEGYRSGKEKGYQDAHRETVEQFQREHANLVADLKRLVTEMDAVRENLHIAAERNLLEFAVSLATKLTFALGKEYHESVVENTKRAIKMIGTKSDLTVRVHPEDLASMEKFAPSLAEQMGESVVVNIIEDETITPGGCTVANEKTEIDAQLETQVDELVTLLLGKKADHG